MSRNQRVAMLAVAALIAVVAFATLRTSDPSNSANTTQTTTSQSTANSVDQGTASTTAQAQPKPKPKPKPPLLTAANPHRLAFAKGDTVRFRVRHSAAEEVHLHGYDIAKDLPAGKTITFQFKADIEGIFEVELEHSGTPLGSVRVEP
jgi:type IV secretory pathway VirB10-like protein